MHTQHGLAALATVLALALGACSTPSFSATPRIGQLAIDGEFGVASSGNRATGSLEQAGLEDDDSVLGGRFDFRWGMPHLTLATQGSEHGGRGQLEVELSQGGITIPAGATVESDLDLALHQGYLTFDLVPTDLVELGLGLGVAVIDLETSFREVGTNAEIGTDELVAVPVVVVRGGVDLGRFDISALVGGIAVDFDGDEASFLDADVQARLHLFGGDEHVAAHLTAGYRWIDLSLDYEDDGDRVEADATFDGPYVGLTISL